MKIGQKKSSIFLIFISLVLLFGFSVSNVKTTYATTEDVVSSYYLLVEDGEYLTSEVEVGKTTGYGTFNIDKTDIPLITDANDGYKFVGWLIKSAGEQKLLSESATIGEITYTITKTDVNFEDGEIDHAELTISNLVEDLVVEPVFDYIYYQLDITNLLDKFALPENQIVENGKTIYYSSLEDSVYNNVVVNDSGKYYFCGNKSSNLDGIKNFKLGENVQFNLSVQSGVNIESTGFFQTALPDEEKINELQATITKDETKKTTAVQINCQLEKSKDLKNVITHEYNDLYIANLTVFVDGATTDAEGIVLIENSIKETGISNAFSYIAGNQYFVKTKSQNSDLPFTVVVPQTYGEGGYTYYNFASLDADTKNVKTYPNIEDDFDIIINYTSNEFSVEFRFALINNNNFFIENNDNFNLNSVNLIRGQILTSNESLTDSNYVQLDKTNLALLGYNHVGYSFSQNVSQILTELNCEIDKTNPTNKVVYVCYEYKQYEVNIINATPITLQKSATSAIEYPYLSMKVGINGNLNSVDVANLNSSEVNYTYKLSSKVILSDTISLSSMLVQDGFEFLGIKLKNESTQEYIEGNSFVLSLETLQTYVLADATEINVYLYAGYQEFTLTYKIQMIENSSNTMADLSFSALPEGANKVELVDGDSDYEVGYKTYKVYGLKKYDQITINATQNLFDASNYYCFVMFTKGVGELSYLATGTNPTTYSHTETLENNKNVVIEVVFAEPSTQLWIVFDLQGAYDTDGISNISVTQDGATLVADSYGKYNPILSELSVELTNGQMNFGYKLTGYTLKYLKDGVEVSASYTLDSTYKITFTPTEENAVYTLIVHAEENTYQLNVKVYEDSTTATSSDFSKIISITDHTISFTKPDGRYVSTAYVGEINDINLSQEWCESNDLRNDNNNQYSYTIADFESFVGRNFTDSTTELNIHLILTKYQYQVGIKYTIENPRGDSYDAFVRFPEITITNFDDYIQTDKTTFTLIPYGENLVFEVSKDWQRGITAVGWNVDNNKTSGYTYEIDSLKKDTVIEYIVKYQEYSIEFDFDINQGNPSVDKDSIKLYDQFLITTNPNFGYKFESISYQKYVEFTGDNFNEMKDELYYFEYGVAVANGEQEKVDGKKYYFITIVTTTETAFYNFTINEFLDEVEGETCVLKFKVNYSYITLTIENVLSNNSDKMVKFDFVGIKISVMRYDESGVLQTFEYGTDVEYVTVSDTISVNIQIKKSYDYYNNGTMVDLTKGIFLSAIGVAGDNENYRATENPNNKGEYNLSFVVSDIIENIVGSSIKIEYTFKVQTKQIILTTNIENIDFYFSETDRNFALQISNMRYTPGGTIVYNTEGNNFAQRSMSFLSKADLSYAFSSVYKDANGNPYFKISSVKIYDITGNTLIADSSDENPDNFASFGITLNYNADGSILNSLTVGYEDDICVEFQIEPLIYFEGNQIGIDDIYTFTRIYACDGLMNGIAQTLTKGTDITSSQIILDSIEIIYSKGVETNVEPMDAGIYTAKIQLTEEGQANYPWLKDFNLDYKLQLEIIPRQIMLELDEQLLNQDKTNNTILTRQYNSNSKFDLPSLWKYLKFVDGDNQSVSKVVNVSYLDSQIKFSTYIDAFISLSKDSDLTQVESKDVIDDYYNFTIYGLALNSSNFKLKNNMVNVIRIDSEESVAVDNSFVFKKVLKITPKVVSVNGLVVEDKVKDGTTKAIIKQSTITLSGTYAIDDVRFDASLINGKTEYIRFVDGNEGSNKQVEIIAKQALIGANAVNYTINNITTQASIYPYSRQIEIDGVGTIQVFNKNALEGNENANIKAIPMTAELVVEIIKPETQDYISIYPHIKQYISRTNIFNVAYKVFFEVNGRKQEIDRSLHMSIPNVNDLSNVVFVKGESANTINYSIDGNNCVVELSQLSTYKNVDDIFVLTSAKALFAPWQIALIVISVVVIIAGVVVTLVIARKKKLARYSVNEKI